MSSPPFPVLGFPYSHCRRGGLPFRATPRQYLTSFLQIFLPNIKTRIRDGYMRNLWTWSVDAKPNNRHCCNIQKGRYYQRVKERLVNSREYWSRVQTRLRGRYAQRTWPTPLYHGARGEVGSLYCELTPWEPETREKPKEKFMISRDVIISRLTLEEVRRARRIREQTWVVDWSVSFLVKMSETYK